MRHTSYAHTPLQRRIARALEILPGALSWSILLGSVVLSFFVPVWVAVFIILFDLYWLIKVVYHIVYLLTSYRRLKKNVQHDWFARVQAHQRFSDIRHLVIIPTYNEPEGVLSTVLQSIADSAYPNDAFFVVLAFEERVGREQAEQRANAMREKFGHVFGEFLTTFHPDDIEGELAGKGSNQAWGAKKAVARIEELGWSVEDVVVSVFDSDTVVHSQYFALLTQRYLTHPKPHRTSYQPIPMFFNNLWDAPALMRVIAMSHTFWMMMEQGRPERLVTFSSHSMSLRALLDIGYWSTDVVSEDSRVFWQSYIHYNGDYSVDPLFLPVYMDTVLADTYVKSIVNQYKQQRRWAYGIENIPYVFLKFWRKRKQISFWKRLVWSARLLEGFVSWATYAIIIFALGWLPLTIGGDAFGQTHLAATLPVVTQVLMTLSMAGAFVAATLSLLLLPKRPDKHRPHKFLFMVVQWVLLPITTMVLGSIPALDAQTRAIFKKYLGFWVTPKARKDDVVQGRTLR